jgi:hypothetical protein
MPTGVFGRQLCKQLANHPGLLSSSSINLRQIHHGNQNSSVTAAATSPQTMASLAKEVDRCYNKLDLSFENGREAFKVK